MGRVVDNAYDERYRRWYRDAAKDYDDRFQGSFAELQARMIVDLLQPRGGMRILDVGAGTGRASLPLAQASDAEIISMDIAPEMLRKAREKRDQAGLQWPAFVNGNGRALPFPDASFDAVVSIRVLHLFPTPQLGAFVDEMKRVLKPGGTLLIEFNSPFAGFGWVFVRELSRRRTRGKDRHYLWPQHVSSLFGDMEQVQVHGFWIPGMGKLARSNPRLKDVLRFARLRPPFGFVGDKVLIRSKKPTSP